MANRNEKKQSDHDYWVNEIKRIRFNFPNNSKPTWQAYTNHPDKNWKITVPETEDSLYPDIVVVNSGIAVMAGEVETNDSLTEEESLQWKEYSEVVNTFYLYVPKGYSSIAYVLAEDIGAKIAGIREYYLGQNGNPVVENKP